MKEYKIDGFLYLPKGTSKNEVYKIIDNKLTNYNINSIEDREHEVAIDFDIIVENTSEEEVEKWFLNTMFDYDVDNYTIKEL